MRIKDIEVLKFNEKTSTGRIFTKESCTLAVEKILPYINKGEFFGELSTDCIHNLDVTLTSCSHRIVDITLDDDKMAVSIDIMNTRYGNEIKDIIKLLLGFGEPTDGNLSRIFNSNFSIHPRMVGISNPESGFTTIKEIITFDIYRETAYTDIVKIGHNVLGDGMATLKPTIEDNKCTEEPIILVHKLPVGNMSRGRCRELLQKYSEEINRNKLDRIINYILPIREGDSDIVCIYPNNLTKESSDTLIEEIKNLNSKLFTNEVN
jgi:hypothetical protein